MSIRLAGELHEALRRVAEREGRPKSALAERLLSEGLAMERHPGIVFVGNASGRRAAVAGTGLDVWEIVWTARNCQEAAEVLDLLNLKPMHLRAALDYHRQHRAEVDELIDRNLRPPEDWEAEYPGVFGRSP